MADMIKSCTVVKVIVFVFISNFLLMSLHRKRRQDLCNIIGNRSCKLSLLFVVDIFNSVKLI